MRIAHVVDSLDVGGAEVLVWQLCLAQRARGHEPVIYAIAGLGELGRAMRESGLEVRAEMGSHLLRASSAFFREFRLSRPHVVHMHNRRPTILAALPARLAGVRSLVSTRHGLVDPPREIAAEAKYMAAALFCHRAVAVCDAAAENLRQMHTIPKAKIVRVYNGTEPVTPVPSDRTLRKEGFTLLFVGRLAAVKNLSLLLRAFALAVARNPALRLWIVGDGTERSPLEELAASLGITSPVTFWGQQLDVAPFFSSADAFILSSRSEGLPISLLQAFSAGLPTIVTDVGGMAEVMQLSKAGYTVQPGNREAMTEAILRLVDCPSERNTFSSAAKTAFQFQFHIDHTADAYLRLYEHAD